MADPKQVLERVMIVLSNAQGDVDSADWSKHDQAISAIMDTTTLFYLETDPLTGEVRDRVIWPVDGAINYGLIPSLVAPLVALLRAQTDTIDGLVETIPGASEDAAWSHWKERLRQYELAIADAYKSGDPDQPSAAVFSRVTAPLLLGYFPADFVKYGIANPAAKSRPDVTWTATTTFQIALSSSVRKQNWSLLWSDMAQSAGRVFETLVNLPANVITATTDAIKAIGRGARDATRALGTGTKVVIGAAVLGGVGYALTAVRKRKRN